MSQAITSADTSLKQVGAVFKKVAKLGGWDESHINLDLGGGKYDLMTEALSDVGVCNLVLDPYNRTAEHNLAVRNILRRTPATSVTISNVLNVIREPAARREVLREAFRLSRPGAKIYITVYPGNRSSKGRKTAKGWQANRPLKNYLKEVRKEFPGAELKGGMIVAERQ